MPLFRYLKRSLSPLLVFLKKLLMGLRMFARKPNWAWEVGSRERNTRDRSRRGALGAGGKTGRQKI